MNFKDLKTTSYNNKIITLSVIFLILLLVIIKFLVLSTLDAINTQKTNIVNQKINLAQMISQEKNMSALNNKIKTIEPKLDIINNIFINENRELEFITQLEAIAESNNVEQRLNFNLNTGKNNNYYLEVPIQITLNGTYTNLMNYLLQLETIKYYININSLTFNNSGSGNTTNDSIINLDISANTYWKQYEKDK